VLEMDIYNYEEFPENMHLEEFKNI